MPDDDPTDDLSPILPRWNAAPEIRVNGNEGVSPEAAPELTIPQQRPSPAEDDDEELPQPDQEGEASDEHRLNRPAARRFTLYASGVDHKVLSRAAVDESEFVTQGSLVILTAIVASVAALSAASYLIAGRFILTPVTILVGIAWGTMIFFFDRALVSGSLNPYAFTQEQVDSFSDPHRASQWTHLIGGQRSRIRRLGEVIKVFAVASIRIALAIATSYIAAEMVLFLIFQPEVTARTRYLQQQIQQQQIRAIQDQFTDQATQRAAKRDQLTGVSDVQLNELKTRVDTLTGKLTNARSDLRKLQDAKAVEEDGLKRQFVLSDGTIVSTTGGNGSGPQAQAFEGQAETQSSIVSDLIGQLATATTDRNKRQRAILTANKGALAELERQDNSDASSERQQIADASTAGATTPGLLLRQAALSMLEKDGNPQTIAPDAVAPCHGTFAWLCAARRTIAPPTPMGAEVAAFRAIFLIIEIFPITYKVIMSLRRRRPYDMAKAAMEVSVYAKAFDEADRVLHGESRQAVVRVNQRRKWSIRGLTPHPDAGRRWQAVLSGAAQAGIGSPDSDSDSELEAEADKGETGMKDHRPRKLTPRPRNVFDRLRRNVRDESGRLPTLNVVMVGGQRTGKTALLAMMYDELSRDRDGKRRYTLYCRDAEKRARLKNNARKVSQPGEVWPPKTDLGEIEEFTFECQVGSDHDAVVAVHYWDYAGDLYDQESRKYRKLVRRLESTTDQADVLLLAIDGELLLRTMTEGSAFGGNAGSAEREFEESVFNLVQVAIGDSDRITHVIITKWDLFERENVGLPAVRDFLHDQTDVQELLNRQSKPIRLIPISSTALAVDPEIQPDGVIKMVKQRGKVRRPVNLSVIFTALLPDRIEAIYQGQSQRAIERLIRQARRDRAKFLGIVTISSAMGFFRRLKTIKVGPVAFEKEATDPREGFLVPWLSATAERFKSSGQRLKDLQQLRLSARGHDQHRFEIVSLLRNSLEEFEGSYSGSMLSSGRVTNDGRRP